MSDCSSPPIDRRNFWQRWLVDPFVQQLTQGVSPEKIAMTVAVGSALALFPVLGTTTLLCLIAGIVFRLNQPIIQTINALCNFIWIPLLVAFVRLGDVLSRNPTASLNLPIMISLLHHAPGEFFRRFSITGLHGVLGWAVVAPFWIPLAYFLTRLPLRTAARRI